MSIAPAPRQLLSPRREFVPTAGAQPLRAASSLRPRQAHLCKLHFHHFFLKKLLFFLPPPPPRERPSLESLRLAEPQPRSASRRSRASGPLFGVHTPHLGILPVPLLWGRGGRGPCPSPAPFAQLECLVGPRRVPADLGQPFKIAPWHRKKGGGPGLWHRQCWRKRGLAETWALPSGSLRVSKELLVPKTWGCRCWKRVPGAGLGARGAAGTGSVSPGGGRLGGYPSPLYKYTGRVNTWEGKKKGYLSKRALLPRGINWSGAILGWQRDGTLTPCLPALSLRLGQGTVRGWRGERGPQMSLLLPATRSTRPC